MMTSVTELYSEIPESMALAFIQGHMVERKQELPYSFYTKALGMLFRHAGLRKLMTA